MTSTKCPNAQTWHVWVHTIDGPSEDIDQPNSRPVKDATLIFAIRVATQLLFCCTFCHSSLWHQINFPDQLVHCIHVHWLALDETHRQKDNGRHEITPCTDKNNGCGAVSMKHNALDLSTMFIGSDLNALTWVSRLSLKHATSFWLTPLCLHTWKVHNWRMPVHVVPCPLLSAIWLTMRCSLSMAEQCGYPTLWILFQLQCIP
jgi:hypothetical protein